MSFHSHSFDAIGVTNQVTVTDPGALGPAAAIARSHLAALDAACSRFRDDGEILALNRAGAAGMEVSPLLFAAVEAALGAAAASDGLVDPTIGAALNGLGYDRDFELIGRRGENGGYELIPAVGWRSVRLDRRSRRITLAPGTRLDLGATAKALAADWIARAVNDATGADVLVSLGGDISVIGAPAEGWPIHVGDDHRLASGGQTVAIREGALATSSTTVRRWRSGAGELHHIVDPATGASASEHWRTVSVTAATCVEANVATTAAIVLGEGAIPWLAERGFAARLVRRDGRVSAIGGWPQEPDSASTAAEHLHREQAATHA